MQSPNHRQAVRGALVAALLLALVAVPLPAAQATPHVVIQDEPVCLDLNVTIDTRPYAQLLLHGIYPEACARPQRVALSASVFEHRSAGLVSFHRQVVLEVVSVLPEPLPLGSAPGPEPVGPAGEDLPGPGSVDLDARWDVTLGTGCRDTSAELQVRAAGQPAEVLLPGEPFASTMCLLLTSLPADPDALVARLAAVAWAVGQAAGGASGAAGGTGAAPQAAVAPLLAGLLRTFGALGEDVAGLHLEAEPDVSGAPAAPFDPSAADAGEAHAAVDPVAGRVSAALANALDAGGKHVGVQGSLSIGASTSVSPPPSSAAPSHAPSGPRGAADPGLPAARPSPVPRPVGDAAAGTAPGPSAPVPGPVLTAAEAVPPTRLAAGVPGAALAAASLLALLAFALYHRIARPRALVHPNRAALHAACMARPAGATAGELATATGLDRKTAEYHLVYLVRLGYLHEDRAPDRPRRFGPPAARPAPAAQPLEAQVLALVRERPGVTTLQVADALGVTGSRVERRVKDLLLDGALESRVDAGTRTLYPAPAQGS